MHADGVMRYNPRGIDDIQRDALMIYNDDVVDDMHADGVVRYNPRGIDDIQPDGLMIYNGNAVDEEGYSFLIHSY